MKDSSRVDILAYIDRGFSVNDVKRALGFSTYEILLVMAEAGVETIDDTAYLSPEGWSLKPLEEDND